MRVKVLPCLLAKSAVTLPPIAAALVASQRLDCYDSNRVTSRRHPVKKIIASPVSSKYLAAIYWMSFILTVSLRDSLPGDSFGFFFLLLMVNGQSEVNWLSGGAMLGFQFDINGHTSAVCFLRVLTFIVLTLDLQDTYTVGFRGGFIGICYTVLLLFPAKTNLRHAPHVIFVFYHCVGPQEGAALHF